MPPAVEQLPIGQPPGQPAGHGRGPQPYRRQSRRARKINFEQLDGLGARADQELREIENALIAFIEAEEKRSRLYVKSKEELEQKYQFGRTDGAS